MNKKALDMIFLQFLKEFLYIRNTELEKEQPVSQVDDDFFYVGENLKRKTEVAPLVVVHDDIQRFDQLSWDFTIKVMEAIPNSISLALA